MKYFAALLLLLPLLAFGEGTATDLPYPVKTAAEQGLEPSPSSQEDWKPEAYTAVGKGTKSEPFVFDTSSVPIIKFPVGDKKVNWDLDEAPVPVFLIEDRYVAFTLDKPGNYKIVVFGDGIYRKIWFTIKSGTDPPDTPDTDDGETPPSQEEIQTGKLSTIIVVDREKLNELKATQLSILTSLKVREYVRDHSEVDGNLARFRIVDKGQNITNLPPKLQDGYNKAVEMMTEAKAPAWLMVTNEHNRGTGVALPLTVDKTLEILKKYGGK